jgi:protein-export membrane protein SecD
MVQVAPWRVVIVILAAIWGVLWAAPNILPDPVRTMLPGFLQQKINLGLDLRGGARLLLEVDVNALQQDKLEAELESMQRTLREAKPAIVSAGAAINGDAARLRVLEPADQERALKLLRDMARQQASSGALGGAPTENYDVTLAADGAIEMRLNRDGLEALARDAVTRSMEVLRRRIDSMGTSEVSITRQGADRIVIEAPGATDPAELKRRVGTTAKMTFHMVVPDVQLTPEDVEANRAPPGAMILPSSDAGEGYVLVRRRAELSGDDLNTASAGFSTQTNMPIVNFSFKQRGASIFCRLTTQNVGQRFATVLDGTVITAPRINGAICGGSGYIEGNFTAEETTRLAALLQAGALPAPLSVIEERTVGAELGQDSINAGVIATVVAGACVIVFMLLAHGFLFGGFALIALAINFVMLMAAMTMIQATLTLPGIAGLILTIAMAVDANVLIYERMRDEQRAGRSPALSIDAGFGKAMITIMDANITTILAALILFQFGAGPVKGFAWTLSIGVVTSVFTAVLVTQVLIAFWFRSTRPKKLPI